MSEISGKSVAVVGKVITLSAAYKTQLATIAVIDPKTQAALLGNLNDRRAQATAVGEIAKAFSVSPAEATTRLVALAKLPKADQVFLAEHGTAVAQASANAPGQWKEWWWVCVGGMVLFLPFVFVMAGRWSPRKARDDERTHQERVHSELAALEHAEA